MSIATLILGESGSGKSTSIGTLDPSKTLLIQALGKPLPFDNANEWVLRDRKNPTKPFNRVVTDDPHEVLAFLKGTSKKIVVIDDYQYVMANEFMRRNKENGYGKFSEIGYNTWQILMEANNPEREIRVYFLWHPELVEGDKLKAKTIGKMLDDKITVEGMFAICLKTEVDDAEKGLYWFQTQSTGRTPAKSPKGMFADFRIPNSLKDVDDAICAYFKIKE